MNMNKLFSTIIITLWLLPFNVSSTGVFPESSVVIVEESDGEGSINLQNTDSFPVLLLSNLHDIEDDTEKLLAVTPPIARVEPGKTQRVRFMLISKSNLKTERLKRVVFEGVPPQDKGSNAVHMTIRQNLPVIIRPTGLAREETPWKLLVWTFKNGALYVTNPSPYIVRLGQEVISLPETLVWNLPQPYILPGQNIMLTRPNKNSIPIPKRIRISPATTWGFTIDNYEAPLAP
ncbi:fimbria/pilus chaperone family protein [Serratia nevei]|uniref:fimbria/pilus chaperone family protein n=1 Tax=Serratia nevei TaxID=2703794 RepID=UPI003FA6C985